MKSLEQILGEIKSIQSNVLSAMQMLESGESMEMTPIEARVKSVCADIQKLPDQDRAATKMPLVTLLDDMDLFYQRLKIKHAELLKQIQGLNPQKQAFSAYAKANKTQDTDES